MHYISDNYCNMGGCSCYAPAVALLKLSSVVHQSPPRIRVRTHYNRNIILKRTKYR